MYAYEEIRHLHLEPSTRCNAACPMCPRNMNGATSPGLALTHLSLGDVRQIFEPQFASRLEAVDFCGAYGDPVMAPDMLGIVEYFRTASPDCRLVLYTNGGIRRPAWWSRLARTMSGSARVVFGIDGVDEVNAVYRRNVDIASVLANATAFIEAGGEAQWDFLVFRHNEHQLEEARSRSAELGFAEFQAKKTGRFVRSAMEYVPELDGRPDTESFPIFSLDGTVIGVLEPPADPAWRNASTAVLEQARQAPGGLVDLLDVTPIDCRVKHARSVFVGAQGYVFPCCQSYTAATLPSVYAWQGDTDRQLEHLIESLGGFDQLNALRTGLRAAVEGKLMSVVEASWSRTSIDSGRLKVCARVCGTLLGTYEKQFASAELVPGRMPER